MGLCSDGGKVMKDIYIENLIVELKKLVDDGDNEKAHEIFDQIVCYLAEKQDNDVMNRIYGITREMIFWYA